MTTRMMMRITAPMPIYMSVLSVGSLLCVYPLALCLVPCQANIVGAG